MKIDLKSLKNIIEETIEARRKCNDLICALLLKENETLHNPLVNKIALIVKKINDNPPLEILKDLKKLEGGA